jgi:hypothetical protein
MEEPDLGCHREPGLLDAPGRSGVVPTVQDPESLRVGGLRPHDGLQEAPVDAPATLGVLCNLLCEVVAVARTSPSVRGQGAFWSLGANALVPILKEDLTVSKWCSYAHLDHPGKRAASTVRVRGLE